ncbi:hypothetical protein AVENLUH5627_02775 [Acinetobacter venetianus]|uniref:DUF4882 domain-containing protein n=1 Tax=Acinetobacter venetianus TaxID=52133 RepID=A0A150HLT0_9GAMM|nr:DUF4882 family protein [Acinetobacter venetianus]KXZ65485.1 hypothetical protein AVENLUH5627_02775 [Acinetobacter venetianus]
MRKIILASLISVLTMGSSFAACTYNFDATNSQISSMGGIPFITQQPQSVSSPITPYRLRFIDSSQQMAANFLNGSVVGDKLVSNVGIVAFEFKINGFASTKPLNDGELDAQITFYGQDTTNNSMLSGMLWLHSGFNGVSAYPESARFGGMLRGGSYNLVNGFPQPINPLVNLAPVPVVLPVGNDFRVGVYLNQTTKELGLIVNGINKGIILNYEKTLKNIGFLISSTQNRIDPNDPIVNQNVGVELITDAANMTLSYPTGTTDMCGTTL